MNTKEKKHTKAQLALVIAFCAAIGLLFLLLLVLPKHAGELSPLEFRSLADHPIIGKSASQLSGELVKGELSSNVDSFLEDHFPARSFFIALNSYYLRLTGRNANQPVIWGRNGRLFDEPLPGESEQFEKNKAKLKEFCDANGLDSYVVIVPSAAIVCTQDAPPVFPDYYDGVYVDSLKGDGSVFVIEPDRSVEGYPGPFGSGDFTCVPDIASLFSAQDDPGSLFYKTDHHWTMDGAYLCYSRLCDKLGIEPVPKESFTVDEYEFYGSFYREAGMWLTKPDTLEVWRSPALDAMNVTIGVGERAVTHSGVYDESKLAEGEVDKYAAYLWSNNGLTVIENPDGNGETLLLVKDSYGNSIAPLFALNYSRIVMLDTRYYRDPQLPMPSELVSEYGITKLMVVFGTESIITDSGLAFLR